MATKSKKKVTEDGETLPPKSDTIGVGKGSLEEWSKIILPKGRKKPKPEELEHISADLRALAVPVASLRLDPRNARLHNARNLEAIKSSLQTFQQRKNLVVRQDGTIIAGNGTFEIAQALGWKYIAAAIVEDDDVTASAYALADNKTAELSEWDTDVLGDLLKELQDHDVDLLGSLGFTDQDIDRLVNTGIEAATTPEEEWEDAGMPEYTQENQLATFVSFTIHFKTEQNLKDFSELVGQPLTKKTRSMWFPPEEKMVLKDRVVAGGGDES